MKSNKEIADLIFSNPDDYEAVVRAIHLPLPEFLHWVWNTHLGAKRTYWIMGRLEVPLISIEEFHDHIQKYKPEILQHFNAKFHISN